jgi:hypothetical protein
MAVAAIEQNFGSTDRRTRTRPGDEFMVQRMAAAELRKLRKQELN